MKVGVVVAQSFWMHFREIYQALKAEHQMTVFQERRWPLQIMSDRINRRLLRNDLATFMRSVDLTFFEWSEHLFVTATHLPKTSAVVTRLHLHELWDYAPSANWSQVDGVIFVSNAMRRKFVATYPDVAPRTHVVHNGVSLSKFQFAARPARKIVIGTLSRIEPHKRVYDLIIVLHLLRQAGYDCMLHIGGSCTESRYERYGFEVKHLVERLGLQSAVIFQGSVSDTPAWFQGVDIFVSNSMSEGLQVALLEAMASGCYCLSHAWDGADEVLPPENIYVGEGGLIERITCYLDWQPADRNRACLLTREIAEERFDIDKQKLKVAKIAAEAAAHAG